MGRDSGSKSGTRGTTSRVQPAFVLVGAPGTNKLGIANELASDEFVERLAVHSFFPPAYGLGLLADYRTELKIAADRATHLHRVDMPTIYTHSLIDSLAYSLARVDVQQEFGTLTPSQRDTWSLTMGIIGCMLRDTFKADEIVFLKGDFNIDTHYDQAKLQEIQSFILDGFAMNYTIIDVEGEGVIDDIATVIRSYISA